MFNRMTTFVRNTPPDMPEEDAARLVVAHHSLYLSGAPAHIETHTPPVQDALRSLDVNKLSYFYAQSGNGNGTCQQNHNGIENIDLHIERGQFVVITGRIGSGKSTLLRVLLGLLPADSGDIYWNDRKVEDPASFFVPPHAAYTAQIPYLFSETLENNIRMGMPATPEDLERAIHRAVLEQDIDQLPDGLQTVVGTRGVKLSGGQRQRVAAARMFVRSPELLVFDDLSSALDVKTERVLWERVFAGHAAGKVPTCLVVSHRHTALQRADTILVLENGRIAAQGDSESLLTTSPEFRYIWGIADDQNGH